MNTSLIKPTDFKAAWEASFLVNRRHLLWNSSKRRTAYMAAYIYRTVAECFPGIGIEYEYNDIDAVLYRVGSDDIASSIEVAIEHENDVRTIATELHNLAQYSCPLNVLVTYTGLMEEYIVRRQSANMAQIQGTLMLILNPEDAQPSNHCRGDVIPWHYYVYANGAFQRI